MFVVAVPLPTMVSGRRGVGLRSSQEKEERQQESDMSQKPQEESVPGKECTTVTNAVGRSSLIRTEKISIGFSVLMTPAISWGSSGGRS